MPIPVGVATLLAGGAGATGVLGLNQLLKQKQEVDPLALVKTLGMVGGGGVLGAILLKKMLKRRELSEHSPAHQMMRQDEPRDPVGVNISFNPSINQLQGSQNRQDDLILSDPQMAKQGMEKLAGRFTRANTGGPSTLGRLFGQSPHGGMIGKVVAEPFKALGRLSGLTNWAAARRIAPHMFGGGSAGDKRLLHQNIQRLSGAGLATKSGIIPSMGIGRPRHVAQQQDLFNRYLMIDPKTGRATGTTPEYQRWATQNPQEAQMLFPGKQPVDLQTWMIDNYNTQLKGTGAQTVGKTLANSTVKNRDYLWPVGAGAGIAGTALVSSANSPEVQFQNMEQPNFLQTGMGEIGDYLSRSGMEGMGDWVKNNPYASAGMGGTGLAALLFLLSRMFQARSDG